MNQKRNNIIQRQVLQRLKLCICPSWGDERVFIFMKDICILLGRYMTLLLLYGGLNKDGRMHRDAEWPKAQILLLIYLLCLSIKLALHTLFSDAGIGILQVTFSRLFCKLPSSWFYKQQPLMADQRERRQGEGFMSSSQLCQLSTGNQGQLCLQSPASLCTLITSCARPPQSFEASRLFHFWWCMHQLHSILAPRER